MFDQIDSLGKLAVVLALAGEDYGPVRGALIVDLPFLCCRVGGVACADVDDPKVFPEFNLPNTPPVASVRGFWDEDVELVRIGKLFAKRRFVDVIEQAFPGLVWIHGSVTEPIYGMLGGAPVALAMPFRHTPEVSS